MLDRHPRVLLTLLCLLCWLPGFFTLPPGDRDESRFAQASKQMLETGDFVRIMNGDEPRNRKPIGIHWLQAPFAAAAHATGLAMENPIWPYRMPSAIGGWVAVMAAYWAGTRLFGRRAALLGAAMLAASLILTIEVHIAKTDAALLGACTVAMAVFCRAYLGDPVGRGQAASFWLAIGVGVLLKGPIAPMVAGLAAAALVIADRRARWLMLLRPVWGVPLMLAVVLPWFIAIGMATNGQFFTDAVGGDLGRKLASGDDAHGGPPGEHLALLPLLLFPASLVLPGAIRLAWRERTRPEIRVLIAWIVPAWVVFEAVPTKLPHYTLPLLPAICLLGACWLTTAPRPGWFSRILPLLAASVLFTLATAIPVVLRISPWLAAAPVASLALVAVLAARSGTPRRMAWSLAAVTLVYGSMIGIELPRATPLWIAPRLSVLRPEGRFGAVGFSEPSLMFSAGTETLFIATGWDGATALAAGAVASVAISDRDQAAFDAQAQRIGLMPRKIGQVSGYNYSRGRRVVLTLFAK